MRHLCLYLSNKHNYKTLTKSDPASLLHWIENILNHSSGTYLDSLTMVALSFIKSNLCVFDEITDKGCKCVKT